MDEAPLFPSSSFLFVIEHMMPLCMVISWVYSVAMMIQHIVAEKEHHLKEVGREGRKAAATAASQGQGGYSGAGKEEGERGNSPREAWLKSQG